MHPQNALRLIRVTCERFTVVSAAQPEKALPPITFISSGSVTSCKAVQFAKATLGSVGVVPQPVTPVRSHFVICLLLINEPQLPPIPILESSPVSLSSVKPAARAARMVVCASSAVMVVMSILPETGGVKFFRRNLI